MTPTHPLGLTSHPEWPKVRERVTQNAIAQQREHQASIRSNRMSGVRAIILGLMAVGLALAWVGDAVAEVLS